MGSWTKKVTKAAEPHLQPGESVRAAVFLQPAGTMGKAVGRGVGGLIGSAVASKLGGADGHEGLVTDSGLAASFPNEPTVLGLTSQRLLVFGYGALGGKPKELRTAIPVSDVASVELDKQKATFRFLLRFRDDTAVAFEAPRMSNEPEAFAAALNQP